MVDRSSKVRIGRQSWPVTHSRRGEWSRERRGDPLEILFHLLNPNLLISSSPFCRSFSPTDTQPARHMLPLSLVFMAITFAVLVIDGGFPASMRNPIPERPAALPPMRHLFPVVRVPPAARVAWLHP
jgi:threonine/homoserine/homoserine lactone efflux protein